MKKQNEFSMDDYLKELDELGPYPAGITPGGLLRGHCREIYEGLGLEDVVEKTKIYASSSLVRRIQSAFL